MDNSIKTASKMESSIKLEMIKDVDSISKREYFAAMAMQGFCVGHARLRDEFDPYLYELFARHSFLLADKMMSESLLLETKAMK